jgi:hypothetical protein
VSQAVIPEKKVFDLQKQLLPIPFASIPRTIQKVVCLCLRLFSKRFARGCMGFPVSRFTITSTNERNTSQARRRVCLPSPLETSNSNHPSLLCSKASVMRDIVLALIYKSQDETYVLLRVPKFDAIHLYVDVFPSSFRK